MVQSYMCLCKLIGWTGPPGQRVCKELPVFSA